MSNTETIDERETPESLRAAAEAGRQTMKENAELRKELLFTKAAIDTSKGVGKLLFKNWDGDDLEALKAEATELGLYAEQPKTEDETPAEDLELAKNRDALRGGAAAAATAPETQHPLDMALGNFHTDIKNGMRVDQARLKAVDTLISAAAGGDQRAIFDKADWQRQQREAGHGE